MRETAGVARRVVRTRVTHVTGGQRGLREELLAGEEPLEIQLHGQPVTVTMRTPGEDMDLAAGYLVAEGLLGAREDLHSLRYACPVRPRPPDDARHIPPTPGQAGEPDPYNVLDARLAPGVTARAPARRTAVATSACGVCGTASLAELALRVRWPVRDDPMRTPAATLCRLPGVLRARQRVFAETGGLHAAGVFTAGGELLALREDVGRHNAVDKVVGWALRSDRLPLRGHILLVSGRAGYELVAKALTAGIPLLAAVSAPTSLAVALAREHGLTLVAFLRADAMNVYSAAERVV